MNEQLQQVVSRLTKCAGEISQLKDQINERVLDIAYQYIEAKKLTVGHANYGPSNLSKNMDSVSWDIDDKGVVTVTWEEHWNYGGHDQGSFQFSSEFIHSTEALENYKKICQTEYERLIEKKKQEEKEKTQREIARLQQTLNA
jgi:hypothetical protein